mmetsp:Transcript_7020/g.11791  ORF Transcript_7020/g.11791 Transcript_7020/m.11791 type:complete len:84 (+) Transcript_7020:16-267(+)|eukprot:CAMPEP_0168619878 /NCGR_PEP_ID=MMETSP0449_2-20121227/6836_1 /TAXON_ID=1082188 /ORGANISM="Strombidium rassoulzadegani, Strain ras09" /LENGTH=83 /DNA_ID=CAMNT_0008660841 /DNA_START=19 /DNA_END=270 /DNA_ORIENTATION=-
MSASIFEKAEIKSVQSHHYLSKYMSAGTWLVLTGVVIYVLATQTHKEQKRLLPYEILISLICYFNYDVAVAVANKIEVLKARE